MDIEPYVTLLETEESVGMIRLGHLPVGLDISSAGYNGRMYLHIQKTTQYAFSGNPHLKHTRFRGHYGDYPIGRNPGETEISYDHQIRTANGSSILWPLAIGDTYKFAHIGEVSSYE